MLFNFSIKKSILILIGLGILINILSFLEIKLRGTERANMVLIFFHLFALIYLISYSMIEKNKNKKIAYRSLMPLVLLELIFRGFNLYEIAPSMDILTHYVGGFAVTSALIFGFNLNIKNSILLSLLIGFGWEFGELAFDNIFPEINSGFYKDNFFWNGVKDMVFHIIGMFTVIGIHKKQPKLQ